MVAIFVALMFVGLVLVDLVLHKVEARRAVARQAREIASEVRAPDARWAVPQGVLIGEHHAWTKPDARLGIQVGAAALVAHALGTVDRIVLPAVGQEFEAGQPLFHVERRGRTLAIPSSLTGKVVAVNAQLERRPALVAEVPYGEGWVCAITPTRATNGTSLARSGLQATRWLAEEFNRFRDFISLQIAPDLAVGLTSQDGGLPTSGALAHLRAEAWKSFESEFLRCK